MATLHELKNLRLKLIMLELDIRRHRKKLPGHVFAREKLEIQINEVKEKIKKVKREIEAHYQLKIFN